MNFIEYISEKSLSINFHFLLILTLGTITGCIALISPVLAGIFIIGLPLVLILEKRPEIGILAIIVSISSIVYEEAIPLIPIGVGSFLMTDAVLLCMFGIIFFKKLFEKNYILVRTSIDKYLLIFYFAALLSAILAVTNYNLDFNQVMRIFRVVTYYLLFFVITNLIRSKKQLKFLVNGLLIIGIIVSLVMIAQAVIGYDSIRLMPGRVESAKASGLEFESVVRILPPGQTLIYMVFLTGLCLITMLEKKSIKLWYYFCIFITSIGNLLTFARTYWTACVLSFILLFLFHKKSTKKRVITLILSSFILFLLPLLNLSSFNNRVSQTLFAVSDRFSSMFKTRKVSESGSFQYRKTENKYARMQIAKHPLFGIGLSNAYRPQLEGFNARTDYIHNGYYWILVKMGLLGFVPFLCFYFGFIIHGFKNWKRIHDPYMRALLTGLTLSGAGGVLINITIPLFMTWFSVVVISTIAGLSEVIIRIDNK